MPRFPLFVLFGAALSATPGLAHIVFAVDHATAGGYYAGELRVSHGCDGSPTRAIRVEIPENVVSVRPQPKPGWSLKIEKVPLATPIAGEGGAKITERVSAIVWTGDLPVDQFDTFGIMMKLPATAGPLYFPTRQTCETGENAWINRPASPDAWHATKEPAPMLIVTPADPHATHGM